MEVNGTVQCPHCHEEFEAELEFEPEDYLQDLD